MLSQEARRIQDTYRYLDGMLNSAWVAGYLGNVRSNPFTILQQGRTLPIHLRGGNRIPNQYRDRSAVRVICHVDGGAADDGTPIAIMSGIGFDVATVLDIDPEAALNASQMASDDEFQPFRGRHTHVSDSANTVRLAGFVHSIKLQKPRNAEGQEPSKMELPSLTIMLRQREDLSRVIPVRYEGRLAAAVYDNVARGHAISIFAKYDLRHEVQKDADGNETKKIYPFLRAMTPPGVASRDTIKTIPAWAEEMIREFKKNRDESRAKREERSEAERQALLAEI